MLEVNDLKTVFKVGSEYLTAVDGISFSIPKGKVVGLVGESGSGKSVSAYSVLNLLPGNGRIHSGSIKWKGEELVGASEAAMRCLRGPDIGLIFQNPLASLNPVFTIGQQMIETIQLHEGLSKKEAKKKVLYWLKKVNISDPEARFDQYPHEFSLGMCQRMMIGLTLSMSPSLLIADEPTASLDVTIQAQILSLLKELQQDLEMSVWMISHDLGVIAQTCDEILVMYLGKIVEQGSPEAIFSNPQHPYTKALIKAIPTPDPSIKQEWDTLKGDVPSPMNLPSGCRFHPRCAEFLGKCAIDEPDLEHKDGRSVACWAVE